MFEVLDEDKEIYEGYYSKHDEHGDLSSQHITGVLLNDSGGILKEVPKTKDTQEGIDLFCQLHSVDRSKVNILSTEDVKAEITQDNEQDFSFDDDEFEQSQEEALRIAKDSRIRQLGLYMDAYERKVTLNFDVPKQVIDLIQQKSTKDTSGYNIMLRSFKGNKLYTTDKYLTIGDIQYLQQVYLQILA
jgi:hypothetical protein